MKKVQEQFDYPDICRVFPQSKDGNSCTSFKVSTEVYERMTNKMHTLFPLFVSIIHSSTYFEQTSSSSGGYFCTSST